jgi:hypothetical protein
MKENEKHKFILIVTLMLAPLAALSADDATTAASDDWEQEISTRRTEYLNWIVEHFGKLEPAMDPRDGRRWALNHARLVLGRDVDRANGYFESFAPPGGDSDIYFIRFLRTLLDCRHSSRLSDKAEARIAGFLKQWPQNALTSRAHWPPRFTENHDLMNLTLGLFAQQYRESDISGHVREIRKFIAHRMERGFVEWNSKCYQYHFSNPLIILVDHAPDETLRRAAQDLLNIMLAERALLSVNGYLGGPSLRCRTTDGNHSLTARKVAYLTDARYDGFLPTVWLALGMGEPRFNFENARVTGLEPAGIHIASGNEPRLKQDEGMFFACSRFVPHPVIRALATEARTRKALVYQGRRFIGWPGDELWNTQKWMPGALYYYNTPHVSMGSVHSDGWIHQCRYNSVIFGADPSQALRVETIVPGVPPHKRRREARGRVVQHKNWLLGQGTLFEDGGAKAERVGKWHVYQVGKGLCAHIALGDDYHVLQVSDLDTFTSREAFVAALTIPERSGDKLNAVTMSGDRVSVDLTNMSIAINGEPRAHPPKMSASADLLRAAARLAEGSGSSEETDEVSMLHDSGPMKSVYGSGKITIESSAGFVTFDSASFRPAPVGLPKLPTAATRWGKADSSDFTAKVNHVRALGGMSPDHETLLKAVSILLPVNDGGSVRLAVYAGSQLDGGPHAGSPAKLLTDFGQTPKGQTGWNTLEHAKGIRIPANTPIWLAWKSSGGKAEVAYFKERSGPSDFQPDRGRWDSKAIKLNPAEPWPRAWPANDSGGFDSFEYSCFLTIAPMDRSNK